MKSCSAEEVGLNDLQRSFTLKSYDGCSPAAAAGAACTSSVPWGNQDSIREQDCQLAPLYPSLDNIYRRARSEVFLYATNKVLFPAFVWTYVKSLSKTAIGPDQIPSQRETTECLTWGDPPLFIPQADPIALPLTSFSLLSILSTSSSPAPSSWSEGPDQRKKSPVKEIGTGAARNEGKTEATCTEGQQCIGQPLAGLGL